MIKDLIGVILLCAAITAWSLVMDHHGPTRCYAIGDVMELGCG